MTFFSASATQSNILYNHSLDSNRYSSIPDSQPAQLNSHAPLRRVLYPYPRSNHHHDDHATTALQLYLPPALLFRQSRPRLRLCPPRYTNGLRPSRLRLDELALHVYDIFYAAFTAGIEIGVDGLSNGLRERDAWDGDYRSAVTSVSASSLYVEEE